ncbi:MAG: hypothetical protein A2W81_02620 [Betaproteobacteria bacterium RIFCSPLOWO2_12_61_14]|nr:MAG: hypothetical protein A2W81_02620 [Betaproteobacteria bacterium RIFCSPLOWO2_12_61_14]
MLVSLRRSYAELITSGAQLLLLFVGVKLESREGWLGCLSAMAIISFAAWLSALKRLRAIRGTPTSRVASAAQGYVELIGRGQPFGDMPLISKLRQLPCLWYRYKVEQRGSKDKWQTIDSGESGDSFLLRDNTGDCVVDPEHAEIVTKHRDQWQEGDYRYTEWKLINSDNLYVIGEFRTRSGAMEFDSRAELNALLVEWKQDKPALHARFDLNNDGKLDMNEWLLARQAAKREVAKKQRAAHAQPDIHLIGQPRDGKLFLISNLTPEKLSRRYLFWSWAHVVIFFGALGGIGWLLQAADF